MIIIIINIDTISIAFFKHLILIQMKLLELLLMIIIMVCSMSHVVWHAEGMESVAGTDGNVVKKPGCMQMIFWDYYGLQVDTNKKPLNNT